MLALHALALGTVLSDGKHQYDKLAGHGIQVRPIGAARASAGSAYQVAKGDLKAGNITQALEGFRQAVREAPQSVDALNGLAVVYDLLGRYDQSRLYYEAALAIDPTAALVTSNYGYSLFQQGDFTAARPFLEAAAHSDDPEARASSRNTLQLIARRAAAPVVTADATPTPLRGSWIEQTSNGEQRLVLDAPVHAEASGTNGAELALVSPAAAWTALDDARVQHEARTQLAAAVQVEKPRSVPGETVAATVETAASMTSTLISAPSDSMPSSVTETADARTPDNAVAPGTVLAAAVATAIATPAPNAEVAVARAQTPAAIMVVDLRSPRLVALSGTRLIAAAANTDPSRRRRGATIQVGGLELARQMVAVRVAPINEPKPLGLDRLTLTLASIGAGASDAIGFSGSALGRLSSGLAMLAAA